MSKYFDAELYKCKGIELEDDTTIVCGYYDYFEKESKIWVEKIDYETKDIYMDYIVINPYTLCRNTGIKINDGYLYEYDLISCSSGINGSEKMGFIEWDDFNNAYSVRSSLNYSSKRQIHGLQIKIIGNIELIKTDFDRMQEYSNKQDENYKTPAMEPECRSTQHINKKLKQFLPK